MQYLSLDIGEKRIGVAVAAAGVAVAVPLDTIAMNEATFRRDIADLVTAHDCSTLVIGYPRNQSGDPTAQTDYVEKMAAALDGLDVTIVFQDESLTSVIAEQRLQQRGGTYAKADIDKEAATIILQDYLELRR